MKENHSFGLQRQTKRLSGNPSRMQMDKTRVPFLGIFIWSLATLYFFYEFFLRVILGTIATEVMFDLQISAERFAMIGSAYYLTYSLMQTPVGILVDRFGVRLLLSIACLICNIGVIGFVMAKGFALALVARLLIGFGSSFAFVCLLVLTLNWFPRKHFAFIIGITQFLGAVGPILAGAPLAFALSKTNNNWRLILSFIAVFGIALNLLLALFVRTSPKGKASEIIFLSKTEPLYDKLRELVKNSQVWWTVFYAGTVYASLPLLGAFWGTSYLETKGFSRPTAAFITSMLWIGLAVGSPTFGKFSEKIKRRKVPLIIAGFLGLVISSFVLYSPTTSKIFLCGLFLLIGFAGAGQSVSFAAISEHVPRKLHATAIGCNNTLVMFFGSLVPPIASSLIQWGSPPGSRIFTEQAFERGFLVIPFLFLIASMIALFGVKETYCRQQHEVFPLEK